MRFAVGFGCSLGWLVALTATFLLLLATPSARSETCFTKPDGRPDADDGWWQWAQVDGRKCWYYSNRKLPKSDLIWSYDSWRFDSDGVVKHRQFYTIEELQNGMRR